MRRFQVSKKRADVDRVKPAERLECWRWEWCWIHGEFDEHGEMIRWRAVGGKKEGTSPKRL